MEYRNLGRSGIKVSLLSYGSWVTFHNQIGDDLVQSCMQTAYDAGVNFFDNAEVYAKGESETLMGNALKRLNWRRGSYLVSSKFFWGINDGPNEKNTLNRKYLLEAVHGSLKRLQLDYLDLIFCHRQDLTTPVEETVWAMNDIINRGDALYWGTSEWSAERIEEAFVVAERLGLRPPVMEQPQYNMLVRRRFEVEYKPLFEKRGLGTTIWSPLASGILTGKYNKGIPADARLGLKDFGWLKERLFSPQTIAVAQELEQIAHGLDCSLTQLSLAWCAKNQNVSTVILGATKVEQLKENLAALPVLEKLTPEVLASIEKVLSKHKIELGQS